MNSLAMRSKYKELAKKFLESTDSMEGDILEDSKDHSSHTKVASSRSTQIVRERPESFVIVTPQSPDPGGTRGQDRKAGHHHHFCCCWSREVPPGPHQRLPEGRRIEGRDPGRSIHRHRREEDPGAVPPELSMRSLRGER